ncbi:hypothetical protein E4631_03660 [Hymenobacter sp. UV11]|uniref:hypothetical protein n=1 Tax=Hymenobacter sp. UV11 TaxID=1849735 RepID=UPI00105D63DC|nr:hypothetical protein [Hymenobacter sp. UV11]TDN36078.1 hypothetical protein A8B98_11825 [Hymenobacter sp. UV11]TFZ68097.1 hypothetical protein E4631_03660 [Hymenobacter sp. UV11]
MPFSTAEFYAVRYQAEPPLVRGVVQRPLSPAEFTEACELLLAKAQQHQCPFWLLDGRADTSERPSDVYEWLGDEFLPRVYKTLGRIPCLAFIARAEFWEAMQARNYASPTSPLFATTFRADWFTSEQDALAWLGQFRPAIGMPVRR